MKNWIPAFAGMTNHIIRQGVPLRKSGACECFTVDRPPLVRGPCQARLKLIQLILHRASRELSPRLPVLRSRAKEKSRGPASSMFLDSGFRRNDLNLRELLGQLRPAVKLLIFDIIDGGAYTGISRGDKRVFRQRNCSIRSSERHDL